MPFKVILILCGQEMFGSGLVVHLVIPGFVRTNITVAGLRGDGSQNGKMQNALAEGMDPWTRARGILEGPEKGKEEFVVGGTKRYTIGLNRFFPGLMKKLIRSNPLQRIKKLQRIFFRGQKRQ
ncbi:hypothetical protein SAMN03080598_00613 [Algoriphagus boritolerans DSM 17298 = JCM 18970]|uniref:Short chain dehydrogenase n=1 Tax=Algoriphagus boritolerans DSM 17298 = JCM 18970 TaxID=1120964 RepID=A0A1H5T049_9BACT|nr:hypothetical protein SAMN03080598_00613 [Algoriphagus boritolerans DSM 17298 = JCM 18970]